MTATRALDAKEYDATKQAVRQLKLQVTGGGGDKAARESSSSPFSKSLQICQREVEAALAEHTVIVRTSGIRPGRENILVEHVDAIREAHARALARVANAYQSNESRWKDELRELQLAHQGALESKALQMAEREKDMEQWQQTLETQHFEELERLTHSYDAKVVEIQKLCNDKIAQANEACEATIAAVRAKMKAWKHAFEVKVKDAVHGKIDQLKAQSEHELKVVMTQLDKEAQALMGALHAARQESKALESRVQDLTKQLKVAETNAGLAAERFQKLQQQLAHEQAQVGHFLHLNEALEQSLHQQREAHEQEKRRLVEQHDVALELADQKSRAQHELELDKLHERVRLAIATKSEIITRLESQVTDAMTRAQSSEAVLMQLNSDIQSCSSRGRAPCKEAFRLDIT